MKEYHKPFARAVTIESLVPLCRGSIPPSEPIIDPDDIEDDDDVVAD